jgi:hypothetical protein
MTGLQRWVTDDSLGYILGREESCDRKFCSKRFHANGSQSTPVHKAELRLGEAEQIAKVRARLDPGPLPL